MVDKNLFPYDLAIVAIFKDEGRYLKEWLDYHLLAGVEHFYLYNNESSDNYAEILKPYVDANLVTLIDWPGNVMQMPAYYDAVSRFRFFCRYMTFIDLDEFIFPKTNQSIVEVVDEVLSHDKQAVGLAINWQCFGSNGHDKADYSHGILERFTRRAPTDWATLKPEELFDDPEDVPLGNMQVKTIANPRAINYFCNPHSAVYFTDFHAVNENGNVVEKFFNVPITAEKISVNHYYTRSREEFLSKLKRGRSDINAKYSLEWFNAYDRNEVFDDGILTYRAARAQNFSLTDDMQRFQRVEKVLVDTLTAQSPFDAKPEFFTGKLETFLTCRKLAEVFGTRIGQRSAEEYALVWIYQNITQTNSFTYAEFQFLLDELPAILSRPFELCKEILQVVRENLIPIFCKALNERAGWVARNELLRLQRFLKLLR